MPKKVIICNNNKKNKSYQRPDKPYPTGDFKTMTLEDKLLACDWDTYKMIRAFGF